MLNQWSNLYLYFYMKISKLWYSCLAAWIISFTSSPENRCWINVMTFANKPFICLIVSCNSSFSDTCTFDFEDLGNFPIYRTRHFFTGPCTLKNMSSFKDIESWMFCDDWGVQASLLCLFISSCNINNICKISYIQIELYLFMSSFYPNE